MRVTIAWMVCLLGVWLMVQATAAEQPLDLKELRRILDEASAYQGKEMPDELMQESAPLVRGEYDPNQFLALFPRLSLEPGWILDFVYDLQSLGGHPVVYARRSDQVPFASLAAFKKEHPRKYFIGNDVRFDPAYLRAIRTDDTPDGFLQLAMLILTGEQFYIYWHAHYSYLSPVIDGEILANIVKGLPADLREKAGKLDITPSVRMDRKGVVVEYVVFSAWGGFKHLTWHVERAFPHRFLGISEKILLPYESGARF